MTEDMYMISVVFGTAVVIVLGLPLVRAYIRRQDRVQTLTPAEAERERVGGVLPSRDPDAR